MNPYELISFRLFLDRIIPAARPHLRAIFPTIVLPLISMAIVVAFAQGFWMRSLLTLDAESFSSDFFMRSFLLGIVFFVFALIYLLAYMALGVASMDAVAGRPLEMGRAWRFAVRGRTLWTLVLMMIALAISVLMCFLPALIVWPLLCLTVPVMVEENRFGLAALKRSAHLVWWNGTGRTVDSNFLQVCVVLFVGWLIQNAVSSLAQAPWMLLQQYWVIRDATGGASDLADPMSVLPPLWMQLITQTLAALTAAVTWFYTTFGFSMLYVEFHRRRKAPDLEKAIFDWTAPALGAQPDRSNDGMDPAGAV